MSTFGRLFRVTTFGESHCLGVGCIVDGVPPGLELTEADVQPQLTRRRPGQSRLATPRDEQDKVVIQSGTEMGVALGTPVSMFVPNLNVKPLDYAEMSNTPRPGHADATYQYKYGIRASSGGGRASARETIGRVAGGAVAEKFLRVTYGTEIVSFVCSVGEVEMPMSERTKRYTREQVDKPIRVLRGACKSSAWKLVSDAKEQRKLDDADEALFVALAAENKHVPAYVQDDVVYDRDGNVVANAKPSDFPGDEVVAIRCPHVPTACRIASLIRRVKSENDSVGGSVMCVCYNVPVGLGEPCFDKLEAMLAHAMLSLPATKGFEIGMGFAACSMRGSQHNDPFEAGNGGVLGVKTNNAGGTLGGISSGAPIVMRVAVKPVSTIGQAQHTADYEGKETVLEAKGRHDPCVLPRTPPLLEAMAALVLADNALLQRTRLGGANTMPEARSLVADPAKKVAHQEASASSSASASASKKPKVDSAL